jgi:SAM-dependent methyltransferase
MKIWVLACLLACGAPQPQRIPAEPPTQIAPPRIPVEPIEAAVVPAAAAPRPVLDDATVLAQSHAWFAAYGKHDSASVIAALGPSFVWFQDARFSGAAELRSNLDARRDKAATERAYVWDDERVYTSPGTAVFIGHALEQAIPGKPPYDIYYSLVWTHDGSKWVITYLHRDRAGIAAERERWNEAYVYGTGFSAKPNALLVDTIKGKKPGKALDIAMGQGRNVLALAAAGWKATGVDMSDEGMRQAKAEAATRKLTFDGLLVDLDNWDLGAAKWDLITLIYAGTQPQMIARIKPALKKGGLFICEYFHADSDVAKTGAGGAATGELAAQFKDGFEILRDDVVEDIADWGGQRTMKLVRFVARKK